MNRSRRHAFGNVSKTVVLLAGIGGLFVMVGRFVGGPGGAAVGLVLGLVIVGVSYWFSDRIAIKAAGARPLAEADAPQFHAMVAELAGRAGLPVPRLYLSPSPQPNAFATGRSPSRAAVAVTQGLLDVCTPDEVRGVVAHELAHIRNRDILIGSVAAAIATGIGFIANMAMFSGLLGSDDEDDRNPFAMLLVALVAPIAATILQLALSRSREYEADRAGAAILGDPEPLARALLKLEVVAGRTPMHLQPAQASAYIVNPLTGRQRNFSQLFLTHPPIEERVARLRAGSFREPEPARAGA